MQEFVPLPFGDMSVELCPCGRGQTYVECCGAIHSGRKPAVTAEDLMRSRYSAFAKSDIGYLRHSWLPNRTPRVIHADGGRQWTGLTIHDTSEGGAFDSTGTVSFTAAFVEGGEPGAQSEKSLFQRHVGRWVYVGPADV